MAKTHGKDWRLYLDEHDFSGMGNNTNVNLTGTAVEVTTHESTWRERIGGLDDWSVDFSGFFEAETSTTGGSRFDQYLESVVAGSTIFGAFPTKPDDGNTGWEGTPTGTEYTITGPVDGPVAITATVSGSGRLSRTTVLSSCTGYTTVAAATGTAVDLGGATEALDSELLTNGGFETAGEGGTDNWADWSEDASDGALANETVSVHGGVDAAKMTAGAGTNTYIHQAASTVAGKLYKLVFWTRGDGTYCGRYYVHAPETNVYPVSTTPTAIAGTSYAIITAYFTAPENTTYVHIVLVCPATDTGIVYYDDVSVKRVTSVKDNTVGFLRITSSSATVNLAASGWVQSASATAGSYTNLISFTAASGTIAETKVAGAANRWVRAKWDTTGATAPNIDFIISVEVYD